MHSSKGMRQAARHDNGFACTCDFGRQGLRQRLSGEPFTERMDLRTNTDALNVRVRTDKSLIAQYFFDHWWCRQGDRQWRGRPRKERTQLRFYPTIRNFPSIERAGYAPSSNSGSRRQGPQIVKAGCVRGPKTSRKAHGRSPEVDRGRDGPQRRVSSL